MSSAAPSTAFNETLHFITSIKLDELEKQRVAFVAHSQVLKEAEAVKDDLVAKVELLLKAIRSWTGSGAVNDATVIGGKLSLANLDRWLLQAKKDPGFNPAIVKEWVDTLEAHIRHSLTRFECAKLFGKLFNEWIASGDSVTAAKPTDVTVAGHGADGEFVEVGRQEMHEQKERLNSLIFEPAAIDTTGLVDYLSSLFAEKDAEDSLKVMRKDIEEFGKSLLRRDITDEDVEWTIKSTLASDLMDEAKRATLREISENRVVLKEVASVLTMRLRSLSTWSWPAKGVVIEMRRHLNGKYRAFTDPELLDALFLEYLGVSWEVKFKQAFLNISRSRAWKAAFSPPTKVEFERETYFLGPQLAGIESHRQKLRADALVSQLPDHVYGTTTYNDSSAIDAGGQYQAPAIKEKLLNFMTADCHLNKTLHGRHTIIRTDFEWFGPSLPHSSILTVLKFFGLSQTWLDFVEVFLRAPLRFKEEPSTDLRTRQRGTPISYALSSLCGEAILFVMDFAVNQRANGLFLYRIHDDLWLWDANAEKCVTAWNEMQSYAALVGLKFNEGKTGSVSIGKEPHPGLPAGDIRWGFLQFPTDQAEFIIDQKDVDTHISELRRQLAAAKSIFGWVNAYNKYMAFFIRNFGGRPANCFGIKHVDDMIDTLARIQKEVFPDAGGSVTKHLQAMIKERFNTPDLPQGYFYFPIESGCLGIRDPIVELLASRSTVLADHHKFFSEKVQGDAELYRTVKEKWESTLPTQTALLTPLSRGDFMTFDEFSALRETRLNDWGAAYTRFLEVPQPASVSLTPAVTAAIKGTWVEGSSWKASDYYTQWIVSLYGEEVVKAFGSLEVVDETLIPVGMVQLFRSSRLKWEQ